MMDWARFKKDYAKVAPASNNNTFESVPSGAYACEIKAATLKTTKTGKSYIELMLEIIEGEYKGFFTKDYKSQPDNGYKTWRGTYNLFVPEEGCEAWKENQFLGTIKAIDVSNGSTFDGNEQSLKGKKVCGLIHKEEYEKDGQVKSVQKFYKLIAMQDYKAGNIGKITDKLLPDDKKDRIFDRQASAPAFNPAPQTSGIPDGFVDVSSDVISDGDLPF